MITYHGGEPFATKEEGAAHMQAHMAWMADIGDDIVLPDAPFKARRIVTAEGASDGGYAGIMGALVFRADDMAAAEAVAAACPFLAMGHIELAELMSMG
ncbi:YciI family protein [Octadecabacter sp. R77987]|uniref:YciI family protein n=1 Tax=Octadecabacter sp. R77987 TaxID=3093874 RepID=UPI00367349E2